MSQSQARPQGQATPSRRGFLWGAAAAGAATAAVVSLPQGAATEAAQAAEPPEPPARGGGYRLTEHVEHYYRTTQV